jgi:ribitol-5-phosphate 2-dehydrogenase (NADP+) / D-ribitol-5-phosphate cytidylyltransferase
MKTVVVFGGTGGIGKATCDAFSASGYVVHSFGSKIVNFELAESQAHVDELLRKIMPDVVVNCVGHFDVTNKESHFKTMNINVGSNWSIIKHYIDNISTKPVKIIMVGSSAYKSGRKSYILYAASKSALYNVWQGASEYFEGSNVSISLINPVKTRTPMIDMSTKDICLEPEDVAQAILTMTSTNSSNLVDMKYPEETK